MMKRSKRADLRFGNAGFSLLEFCLVLVLLAVLTGISVPGYWGARWSAEKKACAANMNTLRGGYEMFALENPAKAGTWQSVSQAEVRKQGFFRSSFVCPSGQLGEDAYKISLATGTATPTFDISCPRHGTLSLQETRDRNMGIDTPSLPAAMWIQCARMILIALIIALPFLARKVLFKGLKWLIQTLWQG